VSASVNEFSAAATLCHGLESWDKDIFCVRHTVHIHNEIPGILSQSKLEFMATLRILGEKAQD
jgi:hypothetical protein